MMKKYLIILIFLTILVLSGLASEKINGNDEAINKIHLQNVVAEHGPALDSLKENLKLRFSRRRRDDSDIKKFLGPDGILLQHQFFQNYVAKHDSHRGGDRKPTVDFDTVLKETVPFNSTDYA